MIDNSQLSNVLVFLVITSLLFSGCGNEKTVQEEPLSPLDSAIAIAKEVESTIAGDSGLVLYHRALEIAKQQENYGRQIYLHDKVAENYSYFRKPEIGKAHIDTALAIAEDHPTHYEWIGMCFSSLAAYYTEKGNHQKGLEWFHKTLDYRLKYLGENHEDISNSYFDLGYYYLKTRNEYDKAIFYNEKALEMRIAEYGPESKAAGECYNNLASAYSRLSDYNKALKYQLKAVEIFEKTLPLNGAGVLDSYSFLARIYYNLGKEREALKWLEKIEECKSNIENYYTKLIAKSQKAKYLILTKPEQAKQIYFEVLDTMIIRFGEEAINTAQIHLQISDYFSKNKKYDSALIHMRIAEKRFYNYFGKESYQYAQISARLSRLFLQTGDYQQSIELATFALKFHANSIIEKELINDNDKSKYPMSFNVAGTLYTRAEAHRKLSTISNLKYSLSDFIEAIEIYEKIKRKYTSDNSRAFVSNNTKKVYNNSIQVAVELAERTKQISYKEIAFSIAEKAKAFNLLNEVQESNAKKFAGIPDSILLIEQNLKSEISFYKNLTYQYARYPNPPVQKIEGAKSKLLNLEREYDNLVYRLEASHPKYYNLKNQGVLIRPTNVMENLSDQEVLVEYYLGEESITIFLLTNQKFDIFNFPDQLEVSSLIKDFYAATNKYERKVADSLNSLIYQTFIKPIADQIPETIKDLKIIPHKELNFLPFDCLKSETGELLIERFNTSYYYSAFFITNEREISGESNKNIIIYAPVYDDKKLNELTPLPNSISEANNIYNYFGEQNATLITRQNATKQHFKENAESYDIIHLATHTYLDKSAINASTISFWGNKESQLSLAETYNLSIKPDLLTLSSCESAYGELAGGEGMLSFTRGFSYSGAKNIVCSLWKVNDYFTSKLMDEMYLQIKEGLEYESALRNAKLRLLKENPDLSPKDWAGFIIIKNE